jgi:hypothetical protein
MSSGPLPILRDFRFKPIFPIHVDIDFELALVYEAFIMSIVYLEEPLRLTLVMKKTKCNHEDVWHSQNKWITHLPWVEYVMNVKGNMH